MSTDQQVTEPAEARGLRTSRNQPVLPPGQAHQEACGEFR
jgi:hypothetical protein